MSRGMLVVTIAMLGTVACAADAGGAPAAFATIANASVACAGTARLDIRAQGITLAEPQDTVQEGSGHYHVYFHDDSGDALVAGWSPTVDVPIPVSATPGTHELHVVLMHDDHTPIEGAARGVVQVEVSDAPCIAPSLTDKTASAGGTIAVDIKVGNFTLVAPGGAPVDGSGHYHLYFHDDSGTALATGYRPSILASIPTSATPGDHELHVVLMNNDHTPVTDSAHGVVKITVE